MRDVVQIGGLDYESSPVQQISNTREVVKSLMFKRELSIALEVAKHIEEQKMEEYGTQSDSIRFDKDVNQRDHGLVIQYAMAKAKGFGFDALLYGKEGDGGADFVIDGGEGKSTSFGKKEEITAPLTEKSLNALMNNAKVNYINYGWMSPENIRKLGNFIRSKREEDITIEVEIFGMTNKQVYNQFKFKRRNWDTCRFWDIPDDYLYQFHSRPYKMVKETNCGYDYLVFYDYTTNKKYAYRLSENGIIEKPVIINDQKYRCRIAQGVKNGSMAIINNYGSIVLNENDSLYLLDKMQH